MKSTDVKRILVGISGAAGVIYGIRLLAVLREVPGVETHLVLTNAARRTMQLETDESPEQLDALATRQYRPGDIAAASASGSFKTTGMAVVPCSMKTVSGIATCYSDNLLLCAADVVLKERRKLVLVVRKTPLHLGHLRLMTQVTEMGAIVMPHAPAFYHRPKSLDDIINQTVNRVLDALGTELGCDLFQRWQGPPDRHANGPAAGHLASRIDPQSCPHRRPCRIDRLLTSACAEPAGEDGKCCDDPGERTANHVAAAIVVD
jgi:4-hydroxy-3-polyprenylbenzoate decarboxylase